MSEQENYQDVVAEELVVISGPPVGEQLRLAREARGLVVADIAQTLKLGQRQVDALEGGDWKSLPGNTFIRGFVRNYARLVQIDSAPLMAQLDEVLEKPVSSLGDSDVAPAAMPHSGSAGSQRSKLVVLIGAGSVVLAALAYFLMPGDLSSLRESTQSLLDSLARKDKEVVAPAPAAEPVFPPGSTPQQVMNPQALAPAEVQSPPSTTAAPATGTNVGQSGKAPQLRFVVDKESWLEVRDRDNKVIFSQRLAAGAEQAMDGHGPLSLNVGYAPGVRVFWHGEAVDLAPHTRGDVARLVLE
ncbi:helix-turn-helix domain-containing protein [Dechloromonas sp. HYN0024]|uniref:helix-turn-helix domain-containing protein n=1 Tax=Dechloromonas sp. HYN0024 TaxID=2231055 RepID=UPI000E4428C6|nr:helix-turn-helix domain-containing protein [Dechloromonas sp. HYN0024]AXS79489.1 helix-turn-helix domain-containing protein [Dechloromonas sp. HYN0024]